MHLSTALSASLERTQLHADLLDGPAPWQSLPGPELTVVAELVTRVLGSNMSAFSVLDRDWQWLTARCGLDEAKLPREHSFCGRVVDTNEAVIIPDTRADLGYREHPLVAGAPHIAAYAGVPVIVHAENGVDVLVGSLCAVYFEPRPFEEADIVELRKLAAIAAALVGGRLTALELAELARQREGDLHRLARMHRQLGQAERMAGIGSWRLDLADNSIHWSDQVYAIHDLAVAQTPPLEEAMTFYPDRSRAILTDAITLATEQGRPFDEEIDFVSATGVAKRVRSIGEVELQNGRPVSLIGVFQDVTARYEMEQALRRSADTDTLTGLINRAGFNRALNSAIATARREDLTFALLLIDLDGFKAVNDRCGHLMGDQVLQTIASTLTASYLTGQVCSRLGGDEFAVIVQGLDEAAVATLIEILRCGLRYEIDLKDGTSLTVSGTIGISWFEPGLNERDMLSRADAALYHGKRRQRGTATSYSPALDHTICSL